MKGIARSVPLFLKHGLIGKTPAKKIAPIIAAARNVMDLNSAAGMEFVLGSRRLRKPPSGTSVSTTKVLGDRLPL
jgi:hypothetical protein